MEAMAQPAFYEPPAPAPSDDFVVLRGVTWADYQRLLEVRGERAVPRLTYIEGVLELMNPSRSHESIKSMIGRLVEAYCVERDVDITPYGSWTHESKETQRGVEPDECYVFGDAPEPDRCDLAIEVIWTSGGLNKLEVYRQLQVKEVWVWKQGRIQVSQLDTDNYIAVERSSFLPDLDFDLLLQFVHVKPMTRAVKDYRTALRSAGVSQGRQPK